MVKKLLGVAVFALILAAFAGAAPAAAAELPGTPAVVATVAPVGGWMRAGPGPAGRQGGDLLGGPAGERAAGRGGAVAAPRLLPLRVHHPAVPHQCRLRWLLLRCDYLVLLSLAFRSL
jgi:hypothetical protein